MPMLPPLSVLDLVPVNTEQTTADAIAASRRLVRAADELGYHRYWVAEHHNTEHVASTSPAVLLANLGAGTERIHLGSAGVMLPNHVPFVVAEQFALLDAMFPGRIDLGLGRAPGTDPFTAAALRRGGAREGVDDFPRNVVELLGLLGDVRPNHNPDALARLHVTPDPGTTRPEVWILGSSLFGAELAGALGLPFTFANHFGMHADARAAADHYREHFTPSPGLEHPYFCVSVSAIAAPTIEEARELAWPSRVAMHQIRAGKPTKVMAPEAAREYAARIPDRELFDSIVGTQLVGVPETVLHGIEALAERTQADEVLLASTTYDVETRIRTLAMIAELRDPSGGRAAHSPA